MGISFRDRHSTRRHKINSAITVSFLSAIIPFFNNCSAPTTLTTQSLSTQIGTDKSQGVSAIPTPSPSPTVNSTPTPIPSPSPIPSGMLWGVNIHFNKGPYISTNQEAIFKKLSENNLRTVRVDINPANSLAVTNMDFLVGLSKKYNIQLRPMLYVSTYTQVYDFVKKYANDVQIWELGNELDLQYKVWSDIAPSVLQMIKAVRQVSKDAGVNLKVTYNMTSDAFDYATNMKNYINANGYDIDYISYHIYELITCPITGTSVWSFETRFTKLAKLGKPILLNETNCAEIYTFRSADNGDSVTCLNSAARLLDYVKTQKIIDVREVNMYELLDETQLTGINTSGEDRFGLMFDLNTPKKTFTLLTDYANGRR